MTINKHNYEVFLIDYLDGKLNPEMVAELMLFLDLNPDIKDELDGIQDTVLVVETMAFPNKSDLKKKSFLKNGIDNTFEYLCIASVEGAITKEEEATLKAFLENNEDKQKEFECFRKTSIKADTTIAFPNKYSLKRATFFPIRNSTLRAVIAIAASFALLIGIYSIGSVFLFNTPNNDQKKGSILASSDLQVKTPSDKNITSNGSSKKEDKTITVIGKGKTFFKPTINAGKSDSTRVIIPVPVPSTLVRLEPREIPIIRDPQSEQLAIIAATYPYYYQYPIEHYYAHQETIVSNSRAKEIGLFEIIQYGVQSFGKLIGKDIHLNAKKDKNGNIEKISFESKLVAFSTSVRKKE